MFFMEIFFKKSYWNTQFDVFKTDTDQSIIAYWSIWYTFACLFTWFSGAFGKFYLKQWCCGVEVRTTAQLHSKFLNSGHAKVYLLLGLPRWFTMMSISINGPSLKKGLTYFVGQQFHKKILLTLSVSSPSASNIPFLNLGSFDIIFLSIYRLREAWCENIHALLNLRLIKLK